MHEYRLLIGGTFERGASRAPAVSPSSGETFAEVGIADLAQADRAVRAAAGAFAPWAATSPFERAAICERVAEAVAERRDELAAALVEDQGKPIGEAIDEVDETGSYFTLAAADAVRTEGSIPPSVSAGRRALCLRVPLGVIGVVTPWNWPFTMGAELFAPAIAAGNTVVWVPAPSTSACSALLVEVMAAAGIPPGVLNFVCGPGPVVGDAVVAHDFVSGVGFIGSIATGRRVATRSAGKAQVLELGGNGPMVILDDADLDIAVPAALEAAFMNAGQSCTAGERFLVHEAVRSEFVDRVVSLSRSEIRLGDPHDPATTMGPLNNEPTADKFDRHVADALRRGARLCTGGRRDPSYPTSLFAEATVLDGVTLEMAIAEEETFGPVVPVVSITSLAEAIEITNTSPFGLTAAVFTEDLSRGLAFAEAARAGWVNVNASTNLWESHLPFGGRAGSVSGRGRVGGRSVIDAFTEPKTVLFPAPKPAR